MYSIDDFQKDLKTVQPKFYIVTVAKQPKSKDDMIATEQFTCNTDLKPSINECFGFLDIDKPAVVQCVQTLKAHKLEAVASKYHINIYRDLATQTDTLAIKHMF